MNCATTYPANPPLRRYSFETVALMRDRFKDREQQCCEAECGSAPRKADSECKERDFHVIEVHFSEHPDPAGGEILKSGLLKGRETPPVYSFTRRPVPVIQENSLNGN
jgi:hypothetical protein